MDKPRDQLDRLMDSAFAGYSDAEPLAGLEERVLNRVRIVEAGRGRRLAWGFAVAASAIVVGIVIWSEPRPVPRPVEMMRATAAPPIAEKLPVAAPESVARRDLRRPPRQKSLPKQEQFPAPTPLTAEERALVAFVERYPAEARQVFADMERSGEPLEIQPIQIPPLQTDGAR